MSNSSELSLNIFAGCHVAVVKTSEVQFHARLEAPIERHLINSDGPLAFVHGRGKMIGRVEVRSIVGDELNALDCPSLAVRQVIGL